MKLLQTFILIVSLMFLCQCGYQFGNRRELPYGYTKLTIPIFQNVTPEPAIESYFTSALIEEFQRHHQVQVTDKTDAQLVLEGKVNSIRFEQGAPISQQNPGFENLPNDAVLVNEYRMVVSVAIVLRKISDQSILWSGDFIGEQQYAAPQVTSAQVNSVNPLYDHSARHITLKVLSRTMMSEAHDRMTENF